MSNYSDRFIKMLKNLKEIILILVIGFCCLYPFRSDFNALPQGVHTWAQSDRYALALGYAAGDPLLQPTTFALYTKNGRVGVEFSGIAWISAKLAVLFNARDYLPGIFRFLSAFWVLASLYFTGLFIFNQHYWLRIIFALFGLASPVLTYYAFNFIPDAHGFAFALAGLAFYIKFLKRNSHKFLILALTFCGLAGLFKLSSAIYLVAILAHQVWLFIIQKSSTKNALITLILSFLFLTLIAYYDYQYFIKVNKELWSAVFMSAPNPVQSRKEVNDVFIGMLYWRSEYFNPIQYFVLFAVLFYGLFIFRKLHVYRSFTILIVLGFGAFFMGLGKQLIHHDYYVVSVFFPFILLVFAMTLYKIMNSFTHKTLAMIAVLAGAVYFQSTSKIIARTQDVYHFRKGEIRSDIDWLRNSHTLLDSLGVQKTDKIFVLYDFAPNTSLIYFGRKGLVFNHEQMSRKEPHLEYWLDRIRPNYLIVPTIWENQFKKDKPLLSKQLTSVRTSKFVIYFYPSAHGS